MGWRGRFTKLDYLILNQDFPLLLQGCDGEALLDFFSFFSPPRGLPSARIPKTGASCPSKRRAAAGGMKLYACAAASRLHRALSTQAGQGGAARPTVVKEIEQGQGETLVCFQGIPDGL